MSPSLRCCGMPPMKSLCGVSATLVVMRLRFAVEAWSPLARGRLLDDRAIAEIARRLGRTPAQVVLRWHVQRGTIVIPKSATPVRIRENLDLFDFELSDEDMQRIAALDRGEAGRTGPHPDRF